VSQSFGYIPKSGIAGSNGRSMERLFSKEENERGLIIMGKGLFYENY
jgi:hypothetical protein